MKKTINDEATASSRPVSHVYLTLKQLGEYLNMSESKLYRDYRCFPHIKLGPAKTKILFNKQEIDSFLKENSVGAIGKEK